MTWDEFKRAVDDALANNGKTGDIEIRYIDISLPSEEDLILDTEDPVGLGVQC